MAVRQYIGARYVAKIYVNSLDPSSADWESGVAYEPLTMVTYNSSSYISRKAVAASVGNPVANPEYWAVTGLYNGQIIALDSRITALETDVSQLQYTRKFAPKYITVTADGVKDCKTLLNELHGSLAALIASLDDTEAISVDSISGYGIADNTHVKINQLFKNDSVIGKLEFDNTDVSAAGVIYINEALLSGTLSENYAADVSINTADSSMLHSDYSDIVPTSGTVFTIEYYEYVILA